jgi:SAM-dependent methyltransferase
VNPSHYSYTHYADPETARTFDARRFGGPIGALLAEAQARLLAAALTPAAHPTVLDVGTGTGRAALQLAAAGARVTGIDASDEMLAVARARAAADVIDVTFREGDAHAIDAPDRSFDAVVCLRVLMHTPRWRDVVHELCRVADRLVVLDFPSAVSAAVLESAARRLAHLIGRAREPYRVFRPASVTKALQAEGFRVRTVQRQFVLPIAVHKAIGSPAFTRGAEGALAAAGLLRLVGSPITVVAERCGS